MIPRLEAEESLTAVERVAVGSGTMDADNQRSAQQGWLDAINGPAKRETPPTHRPIPSAALLGPMGVAVHRVPRKPQPPPE